MKFLGEYVENANSKQNYRHFKTYRTIKLVLLHEIYSADDRMGNFERSSRPQTRLNSNLVSMGLERVQKGF